MSERPPGMPETRALIELTRRAALEEAAKIADAYASVNIEAAGDTILLDPVLSGRDRSPEAFDKSRELTIEGCIHSSMYHAAKNIAEAIRALANLPLDTPEPEGGCVSP